MFFTRIMSEVSRLTMVLMLLLAVPLALASCSPLNQPSRNSVAEKIPALVEIEERAKYMMVKVGMYDKAEMLTQEYARKIKFHYDMYYVYHKAAVVDAAKDNRTFQQNVKAADKELDSMEAILNGSAL